MPTKKDAPTKEIVFTARVYSKDTMFFRVPMASAEDENGHKYEVASNINGDSVLISVDWGQPGGAVYAIGVRELIDGARKAHGIARDAS